jgi:hypothetical protein
MNNPSNGDNATTEVEMEKCNQQYCIININCWLVG